VHHDTPDANANTRFFLRHALHDRADFVFILNGESQLRDEIPDDLPNVRVVQRDNTCYDLGAHGEVLQANERELVKKYNKFILMNGEPAPPDCVAFVLSQGTGADWQGVWRRMQPPCAGRSCHAGAGSAGPTRSPTRLRTTSR